MLIGICGGAGSGKSTSASYLTRRHDRRHTRSSRMFEQMAYVKRSCEFTQIAKGTQIAFADPIKSMVGDFFDIDPDILWGPSKNRSKLIKKYKSGNLKAWAEVYGKSIPPDVGYYLKDVVGARNKLLEVFALLRAESEDGLSVRRACQLLGTEFARSCNPTIWIDYGMQRALWHLDQGEEPLVVVSDIREPVEAQAIWDHGGYMVRLYRRDNVLRTNEEANHPSETLVDQIDPNYKIFNDRSKRYLLSDWRFVMDSIAARHPW